MNSRLSCAFFVIANSNFMINGPALIRLIATRMRPAMDFSAFVGEGARNQLDKVLQTAAIVAAVQIAMLRPSYWRRTVRQAFARQMVLCGAHAVGIVGFLAIALGVLLVVQYQVWLGSVFQSQLLGPLLVAVVVRELAPILVNLVLIARSGSTIATELALVHVAGEDRVAEGQGLDLVGYFVVPRVLALTLSALCLTLIFTACAILSVYVFGQWTDTKTGTFWDFSQETLGAITLVDVVSMLLKSTVPAMLTGCISCAEGLGAGDRTASIPRASRIAVQRSVVALFGVCTLISIATYS